jgi:hypothetical protein
MCKAEKDKSINKIKEICRDIGCSGLYPDMCKNNPHHCNIIREILNKVKEE